MSFTATDVKNLREMTGAGMMDCKRALTASEGNIDGAITFLREKGLAAAAKKAGRIAAEGLVVALVSEDAASAALIEVNSETDFVAKNESFQVFINDLAKLVLDKAPADVDALKALSYPNSDLTVEGMLQEKVLTIGENIQIRRFVRFDGGKNAAYIHMGGKMGVIAKFELDGICASNEEYKVMAKDVCMQIAAMKPIYVSKDDVSAETIENEKNILMAQAKNENEQSAKPKPDAILEKIVMGRISKYYEEFCVCEQIFVKDDTLTIGKYIANTAAKIGGSIRLLEFARYEKGEGIEKKQDDLAAEVAGMVNK